MPSKKDGTALRRQTATFALTILPALLFGWGAETRAQQPHPPSFRAEHYEVSASLDSVGQAINATARVTFIAQEASRNVEVELHPNLNVASVKGEDGKAVPFERNHENALLLRATLPATVAVGGKVMLTYTYSGVLANEENSPVPSVRVASISREYAYLLLPSRWFPLTGFPSSRYTANFRLEVPDSYAVAG